MTANNDMVGAVIFQKKIRYSFWKLEIIELTPAICTDDPKKAMTTTDGTVEPYIILTYPNGYSEGRKINPEWVIDNSQKERYLEECRYYDDAVNAGIEIIKEIGKRWVIKFGNWEKSLKI